MTSKCLHMANITGGNPLHTIFRDAFSQHEQSLNSKLQGFSILKPPDWSVTSLYFTLININDCVMFSVNLIVVEKSLTSYLSIGIFFKSFTLDLSLPVVC